MLTPCDEGRKTQTFMRGKMKNYISKNQLKNYLGVSISTIDRKLKELPHVKLGNARKSRVLFPIEKIEKYLDDKSSQKKES